jgi:hypothetical protein
VFGAFLATTGQRVDVVEPLAVMAGATTIGPRAIAALGKASKFGQAEARKNLPARILKAPLNLKDAPAQASLLGRAT